MKCLKEGKKGEKSKTNDARKKKEDIIGKERRKKFKNIIN